MGFVVIGVCCAAEIVIKHCESWTMIGLTLAGGAALGYKAMQEVQKKPASKDDLPENDRNHENAEESIIDLNFDLKIDEDNSDDEENRDEVKKALIAGSPSQIYNFGRSPSREMVVKPLSSRSPRSARRD